MAVEIAGPLREAVRSMELEYLYIERSKVAQQEQAAATALLETHAAGREAPPSLDVLRGLVERVGGAVGLLSTPKCRTTSAL